MRRTEKNTNKIKGVFLQSLSSVGDVNTFQKAWQGGIITQINLGVIDCYSLVTSSLECSPHLHMLGFGHFLTKYIVCPCEVVKIFSLSISSFCFYGSRFKKKKKKKRRKGKKKKERVSSKKATFSTELTRKQGAGIPVRRKHSVRNYPTPVQLSTFSDPAFHLSCFCVK